MARWNHTLAGGSQTSFQTYFDTYRRDDMGVPEVLTDFRSRLPASYCGGGSPRYRLGAGLSGEQLRTLAGIRRLILATFTNRQSVQRICSGRNPRVRFPLVHGRRANWSTTRTPVWKQSPVCAWPGVLPAASIRSGRLHPRPYASRRRADTAVQTDLETIPIAPGTGSGVPIFRQSAHQGRGTSGLRIGVSNRVHENSFPRRHDLLELLSSFADRGAPAAGDHSGLTRHISNPDAIRQQGTRSDLWRRNIDAVECDLALADQPGLLLPACHHPARPVFPRSSRIRYQATGFPQNMFQIRSSLNLSRRTEFDQSLYYTARLPGGSIPGHARLDLRLARRLGESAVISLVGQNLLRPRSTEYGDSYSIVGTQSVRSVYGQITWRF